ncbi:hypothetical protein RHMOL_Rhmol08G0004400 [Rhododendron molle]|uniref:Uncharacterized protein n=1 Tax=Rhododendron molle TaxID=49168 RepID=A0ACC0MK35_RHOML|nr:hypothetical protein RHMOL_Rhmol08G0004400 [Rhododendron molle]
MQPPESSTDGSPSPTRRQLQGPRPPQLRVRKDSHMIKKPPIAPHPQAPPRPPQHAAAGPSQSRQPVIIYAVSPKVIHTTVTDFMSLVQRLTGSSSADHASSANRGDVSPAARLASIERTSPRERERDREREVASDIMGMVEGIEVGQGHNPGILSPAPATLPPISPGYFFSPRSDPHGFSILQDLSSPFNLGNNMFMTSPSTLFSAPNPFNQGNNMFMTSPSTLFSAPMASPSPSSFDLFNQQFFDF